jgi:hypothetical protein
VEVQDAASLMGQHQKHVKNLETDRGHGEEIDGGQLLGMNDPDNTSAETLMRAAEIGRKSGLRYT